MYESYLEQLNFKAFTPIQKESFFAFQSGKSIVGIAPTGTGKTLAYGIPIVDSLKATLNQIQVIIMLPTTELIKQVENMLSVVRPTITIKTVTGLDDLNKVSGQLKKQPPHILISSPKKLHELMFDKQAINTKYVKHVILDEADMMFDIDFMQDISQMSERLLSARFHLYSASLKPTMKPFIRKFFGAYQLIDTSKQHTLPINYLFVETHHESKMNTLVDVIQSITPYLGIIFVSNKDVLEDVHQYLVDAGIDLPMISSKQQLRKRLQLMKKMVSLDVSWVLSTDVLARGIDLDVSHVIHFDLPKPLSLFMHRSGRTGRMDRSGTVITIYDRKDVINIEKLIKQGIPFKKAVVHNQVLIEKQKREKKQIQPTSIKKKKIKVKPNYKKKLKEGKR
jgi:ATP-dependent RNA helicase CshB